MVNHLALQVPGKKNLNTGVKFCRIVCAGLCPLTTFWRTDKPPCKFLILVFRFFLPGTWRVEYRILWLSILVSIASVTRIPRTRTAPYFLGRG